MERIIEIIPAFDKRYTTPGKNYGVHGVDMRFVLKGNEGAVQFVLYTNWHLPHVEKELDSRTDIGFPHLSCHPQPADLGYHSPRPVYEGHKVVNDKCPYIDGRPCYYDGSGLNAEEVYKVMVEKGGDAMWKELKDYYDRTFKKVEEVAG